MKKKGWIIILLIFIPGLLFLNYIGVFNKTKIEERTMGPYIMVYKKHEGEYKYTGAVIQSVFQILKASNIKAGVGFGIFYDDPKTTPKEKLRSEAGVLLNKTLKLVNSDSVKVRGFETQKCVVARYPNKNFLSIYSGIAKVYPKLKKYLKEKGYKEAPVMEIYEEEEILYVIAVEK